MIFLHVVYLDGCWSLEQKSHQSPVSRLRRPISGDLDHGGPESDRSMELVGVSWVKRMTGTKRVNETDTL